MTEQRIHKGCPVCGYQFIARENDEIICLGYHCNWREKSKRENDKQIPTASEIKRDWR